MLLKPKSFHESSDGEISIVLSGAGPVKAERRQKITFISEFPFFELFIFIVLEVKLCRSNIVIAIDLHG